MEYIWARETLCSLFKHRSEDVQDWAASRLLALYPEVEPDLLEALPRVSPLVASLILSGVRGQSCPSSLTNFFQQTKERHLKARAAALLIRSGRELPADQLAAVDLGGVLDLLAETERGFDFLLERYRAADEAVDPLLHPLAQACGFSEIFLRLEEEPDKKGWRKAIAELGGAWGCALAELHGVRRAHEAIVALEQTLASPPTQDIADALWKRELEASLARDRARIQAIANAAKGRISRLPEPSPSELAFLLSCALALGRDAHCQGILLDAGEVAELWQGIVLRPWRAEVGPGLTDSLCRVDPERVLSSLKTALSRAYACAAYPFQILNALAIPGRFELFLEAFQGKYDKRFSDAAEEALAAGGPLAAQAIVERFHLNLPDPADLLVLGDMPTQAVEEFLLEHFDHYMRNPWSTTFVEVLESVASRRFLEPLLVEWRVGELALGRTITLLSAIYGVQEQGMREIARDVEEQSRAFKLVMERARKAPERAFRELLEGGTSFTLPLRCTACGRTYHYALTKVFVNPKKVQEVVVGQIIQCKGCGSIETYELTRATDLALGAEVLRVGALAELDKSQRTSKTRAQPPASPLVPQKLQLMAAGRRFRTLGEAYWFLKGEIDRDPAGGELHRRLGNILKNGGRPDLALPYFLKAITLTPGDAEAYYNLVDILLAQERFREAIPYVETLVRLCREGQMDETLRRDLFANLLEQVQVVAEKTGHRVELFPRVGKPGVPLPGMDREQGPAVVYLTSFDLADPNDFERAYRMFRMGYLQEAPARGPLRFLREHLPWGGASPEDRASPAPPIREPQRKVGRNAPCPCGSGRKYKKCCGR